jgi:heptosyltransferase-2
MKTIRKAYPEAEITLLTSPGEEGNPGAAELLKGAEWIDHLYVYHSAELNSLRKIWLFSNKLRYERFDIWFQLPQDLTTFKTELRNMFFAKVVGVKWAVGYHVNTLKFFVRDQAEHQKFIRESGLQCRHLKNIGINSCNAGSGLSIPDEDLAVADKLKAEFGLIGSSIMAIAPGGKRPSNRWPVERFAEIGRRWIAGGGHVVIVGSSADRDLGERIRKECGVRAANLCGKTTLLGTAGILRLSELLVTNDSGPMHLAAAVSTPCVVAFSARDFPVKWHPVGEHHIILRKDVPCSPCFLEACPNNNLCMTEVQVDEIWDAVTRITKKENHTLKEVVA